METEKRAPKMSQKIVNLTLHCADDMPDALITGICIGALMRALMPDDINIKVIDAECGEYLVSRDYRPKT